MERAGLKNPGSLIPWPGNFAQTALPEQEGEVGIGPAVAQEVAHGSLVVGEQAVADSAPSAVSRSRLQVPQNGSETLEINPISPDSVGEAEPLRRRRARRTFASQRLEGPDGRDALEDLAARERAGSGPTALGRRAA